MPGVLLKSIYGNLLIKILESRETKMENSNLQLTIAETYGFKQELITNIIEVPGTQIIFTVKDIVYMGDVRFCGAKPMLEVIGYKTSFFWKDTPVMDVFYNEFIKDAPCIILKAVDIKNGMWEDTGIILPNQEAARAYISRLKNPGMYTYEIAPKGYGNDWKEDEYEETDS